MKRRLLAIALVCTLALALAWVAPAQAQKLTPQEERGRHIYFKGTSPRGNPITAYFGVALMEMPGERAVCATCHGYDGTGRPESGVIPSNVTWTYLTKSYGRLAPDGAERPPFTMESLRTYMYTGFYPNDTKGDPSMPLYLMADDDMEDLLAFLVKIGTIPDPGVSDGALRVGTILPSEPGLQGLGDAVAKTLWAYFSDINERGGIFGRKLELAVGKAGRSAEAVGKAVDQLAGSEAFALVGTVTPGLDADLADLADKAEVPVVGPFTLFPVEASALNRAMFYIYPGLREQAQALATYAAKDLPAEKRRCLILHPSGRDFAGVAGSLEEFMTAAGWEEVQKREYEPEKLDAAAALALSRKKGLGTVLFLGGDTDASALFKEADKAKEGPAILASGVMIGKAVGDITANLRKRVLIAFPSLPEDRREPGMKEYGELLQKHGVTVTNPAAQMSSFVAAKVLVEGLRKSGRDLNREKLIAGLETLLDFETGLTPKMTFNRNHRVGILGAWVVTVDPEKAGTKDFIASRIWVALRQ